MKTDSATFWISDQETLWMVYFRYLDGNPREVILESDEKNRQVIPNAEGRYRPCVTHCEDLIRQVTGKPPSNFDARWKAEVRQDRPQLGLVVGEDEL